MKKIEMDIIEVSETELENVTGGVNDYETSIVIDPNHDQNSIRGSSGTDIISVRGPIETVRGQNN